MTKRKITTGYTAEFKTKGFWFIPGILGWSKSEVIKCNYRIGVMFTLHITPFFNLGFNNPRVKFIDREVFDPIIELTWLDGVLETLYDKYVSNQDLNDVVIAVGYNQTDMKLTFFVSNENIEIPTSFAGFEIEKKVVSDFIMN